MPRKLLWRKKETKIWHKLHNRINDLSKELSPYNYKNVCLQKIDNINLGLNKNSLIERVIVI
jgi:mRNA deadenylase 3'-5' endonuclease subunit Ccr4